MKNKDEFSQNTYAYRWEIISNCTLISSLIFFIAYFMPISLGPGNLEAKEFSTVGKHLLYWATSISAISCIIYIFTANILFSKSIYHKFLDYLFSVLNLIFLFFFLHGVCLPKGNNSYDGRTVVGKAYYYLIDEPISFCVDFIITFVIILLLRKVNRINFQLLYLYPLVFFLAYGIYSAHATKNNENIEPPEKITYSRTDNTIVFLFDGMSNRVLTEILRSNPSYNRVFSGFTNFTEAITKHPGTWASTGEILGGRNYSIEAVLQAGKKPKKMALSAAPLNTVKAFLKHNNNMSAKYFRFEDAFGGERNNVVLNYILIAMINVIPYNLREPFYSNGSWSGIPATALKLAHNFPDFIEHSIINPLNVSSNYFKSAVDIFSNQSIDEKHEKSLSIFYFSIPHAPFILDAQCNQIQEEKNFLAYEAQSKCALKFASSTIDFLKKNNLLDKSRILIVSDHGWPSNSPSLPDTMLVPNGGYQGRMSSDMLGSVLMYKGINSNNSGIKNNSKSIYVQDAFKIICNDGMVCPEGLKGNFQDPSVVYTTSTSEGTWDEGPFVVTGLYKFKGTYRNPKNWTTLNER